MDLRITPISAKLNINFKQVTCVQIPKNTFVNPENVMECSEIFTKKLDAATGCKRSVVSGLTKHIKKPQMYWKVCHIV